MAAVTADQVVVQLDARVAGYIRNVVQAEARFAQAMANVSKSARQTEAVAGGAFKSIGVLFAVAFAGKAAIDLIDSAIRIQNALRVAGLEGDRATAVFDRLFAAAQKNAAPVEALVQLYGRAALVQKELGISTEELLRFTEGVAAALRVSGQTAAQSSGALLQLAQALGSGTVRAEEFNSILEGALPIAQAAARGLEEAGGSVAKLRQLVIDGKVSSEAFFRAFEAGQGSLEALASVTEITVGGAFTRLYNVLVLAAGQFNNTLGVSRSIVEAMNDVGDAVKFATDMFDRLANVDLGALGKVAEVWGRLAADFSDKIDRFTGKLLRGEFQGTAGAEEFRRFLDETEEHARAIDQVKKTLEATPPVPSVISPEAVAEAEAVTARVEQAFQDAAQSAAKAQVSLSQFKTPPKARTGATPGDKFANDIRTIRERTSALELEARMIGFTRGESEKALAVLDLENAAKQHGLTLTPQLIEQINAQADAYAHATVNLAEMEAQQQRVEELQQFFGDTLITAFNDLAPAINSGNKALDNFLQTLIQAVLQATLLGQGPLAGLFGSAGPAGGSGIGGIIGSLFQRRAAGGPAPAGQPIVVGEKRPELFVPNVNGHIQPRVGSGGASGRMESRSVIDVQPSPLFIASVRQEVRTGLEGFRGEIPSLVTKARKDREL